MAHLAQGVDDLLLRGSAIGLEHLLDVEVLTQQINRHGPA